MESRRFCFRALPKYILGAAGIYRSVTADLLILRSFAVDWTIYDTIKKVPIFSAKEPMIRKHRRLAKNDADLNNTDNQQDATITVY
jgi:hypothetical protein